MTLNALRTRLIFCEGDHDVVLVRFLLKDHLKFTERKWQFDELPSPFNSYFPNRIKSHAAANLELGLVHDFFLPNHVLEKDNQLVLIFRTGGETRTNALKEFLTDFEEHISASRIFPMSGKNMPASVVGDFAYLFLYDADDAGPDGKRTVAFDTWGVIDGKNWLQSPWVVNPDFPMAAASGNSSIYIWSANGLTGTLEDLLYPVFEKDQPEIINQSSEFVEAFLGLPEETSASISKYKKVIMTIAGQKKKPGLGLHTIFKEGKLVKVVSMLENVNIKNFSDFLETFI